jgi:hypothetical protein
MTSTTVAISGNTFPVKDQIKALGGRWNSEAKAWMVPADRADQARALVAGAPQSSGSSSSSYRPRKCKVCGHVERRDRRGYAIGDYILRSGECQSCYEERKMGY